MFRDQSVSPIKVEPPPWSIAASQHGVITRRQLELSPGGVAHWVRTGRLHPVYRGVYAYGHAALSQHGRWLAAVLAAGDGAVLGRLSVAALLRLIRYVPGTIDVIVPKPRRAQPGFRTHTCRNLDPRDVTVVQGIPITTVARMLVDLTDEQEPHELANLIDEAVYRRCFDFAATRAAAARANGRRKIAVLDEALELHRSGSAGSRSRLERRFLRLVRGAGLPEPLLNVDVNGFEVDFHWPGVCVEVDGPAHRRARVRVDDRIRDAALQAAGFTVLRFRDTDLDQRPAWILSQLAAHGVRERAARR